MILLFVVLALVLMIVPISVYSQTTNIDKGDEALRHLGKLQLMMQSCTAKVQSGDLGFIQMCVDIVEKFNIHMRQLFNETRENMTKILLD